MGKKINLGEPIKLELSNRYYQFNRQYAVRDVFDALVELITNSDDSYHRLYTREEINKDGGPILIEYMEQRGGAPSILRVRDRAEGLTLNEMVAKLGTVGTRTSDYGDRGFMARGAKDCTELGDMEIESIKDNKYYACKLTTKPELIPTVNGRKTTKAKREELGIFRGNGTTVSLYVDPTHRMPRMATIVRDLPWHFALRDILSVDSPTKVQIKNLNEPNSSPEPIVYRQPEGQPIIQDFEFKVPDYPSAKAILYIYRAPEPLENTGDKRFRKSGFLIKGKRAIHECSLLLQEFENDPYAKHYFGRIECQYIDTLLEEYDDYRTKGKTPPDSNPRLLIDPNRQSGLIEEHPFTKALFQVPSERLRALISKDREKEREKRQKIENKETRNRLNKLAKAASDFMKEQLEDITELTAGEEVDTSAFPERGVVIIPTYVKLNIGESKTLWMYVSNQLIKNSNTIVKVSKDGNELELIDDTFELIPHPKKNDRHVGTFRVKANSVSDGVYIKAEADGIPKAEAIIEIVKPGIEVRDFTNPLEFEHIQYHVRQGSHRTLKLFALYPDLVNQETPVKVWSEDSETAEVRGSYSISPIANSNFALAEIKIQGRKLNGRTKIYAEVNGRDTFAKVHVSQTERQGVPLEIEFRDEDFYNYRAIWADYEGKPNLLLVSTRHKSIKRYLGPPPDFEGQNSPIFRLLLAEIVAESVCRKVMQIDAKARPWDYRLADLLDDHVIVDEVLAKLHSRIRNFVASAHDIMLSDKELREIQQN